MSSHIPAIENAIRLYQLQPNKGVRVMVECKDGSNYVVFHHVDGIYSYCTTANGGVCHLAAYTPLRYLHDGVYEIIEDEVA